MSAEIETRRLFGSVERRLFRVTAILLAIVALVLLIAIVVWALAATLSFSYKLVLPLSVAGILALVSGGRLRGQAKSLLAVFSTATQRNILYFIDVFTRQVTGFFQGQLVIAVIMGVLFATGFTLIGLKGGILIGLVLGLLNIVPFLGTLVGLLIVLPMAYFQPAGSLHLVGLSLLVFVIVQLVESWLLTPRIMANRSGLHPALVVISVFFWGTALGGIIGMILAVPLTAFVVAVWAQAKASLARGMMSDEDVSRIEVVAGSQSEPPLVRHGTDAALVVE